MAKADQVKIKIIVLPRYISVMAIMLKGTKKVKIPPSIAPAIKENEVIISKLGI